MLPIPRVTLLLLRSNRPRVNATFTISAGVPDIGSSAISTNGIPSLSSPYSFNRGLVEINFAASSSKHIPWTPTLLKLSTSK